MVQLIKASMAVGQSAQQVSPRRGRPPAPEAPLGESFRFVEWADEYAILNLYRRIIVRGDDATKSLQLIRSAIELYGYVAVVEAVHAYAKEAADSEARFRKRPFTFFQSDMVQQYVPVSKEAVGAPVSPVDDLRASIVRARAEREAQKTGDLAA